MKTRAPKPSKLELFNAALAAAEGAPTTEAATRRRSLPPRRPPRKPPKPTRPSSRPRAASTLKRRPRIDRADAYRRRRRG
ncbi:hypothetical protein I553_7301 [Mycobacterium xenopi 4042]|uniref:Uncharacterized protein n=1 Tax=Mycobacterium xenopi 4042 TaxID=1299334 RepID=X8E997_MYCXE|nr:hypothetical protein I553_7301 [Mycobacterium xenopi 4042]